MTREEQIRENRRQGMAKARAKLVAKYTDEELRQLKSKAGKSNSTKFNSERARLAANKRWGQNEETKKG